MLHKYDDFKFEILLESLINESKLVFSNKLLNLLGSMPDSNLKKELLDVSSKGADLNLIQNFFDVSNTSKEEITFIQDRRAQQILGVEDLKYKLSSEASNRYLTFNKDANGQYKNKIIFDALNFNPDAVPHRNPSGGEVGIILGETESRKTPGKIYVLFKFGEYHAVVNKSVLEPYDDRLDRVWQLTKNPIRIGRAIRSIISAANINSTDKEIEEFVNQYKSSWDIMNDAFLKFDIVKGDDIAYWYNIERYEDRGRSTLGNSCMAEVDSDYFDIYTQNPDVCSLVILYSDRGQIVDGKWKSDKIKGRSLLWKTTDGDMLMDRIYYNYDSDIELFKQFAERNGFWCKEDQDSSTDFDAVLGSQRKSVNYSVKLTHAEFDRYPYVDTLCFIDIDSGLISNDSSGMEFEMRSTNGEIEDI